MENLISGDKVKVIEIHKNSIGVLTGGKEYLVVSINKEKHKFCIKDDSNKKRWYRFNNMMFIKIQNINYSNEQLRLMHEFARCIEHLFDSWLSAKDNPNRDAIYEKDKDTNVVHYLTMLNSSQ